MNFESLKAGFKDYLIKLQAQKTGKSEAQVENEEFSASSTNIFLHEDEFKQYLAREVGQDVSIFSKSIDEIMEMQIVDGKLVDAKEENKNNFDDEAKLEEAQSLQDSLVASMEAENSQGEAGEIPQEMMEGVSEFVTDDFNAMLQDENVISTLDADGSGDLNIDEVGSFLGTINTDNDDKLSFEELSAGFTSIAEGKYQETYLEPQSESAGNFINRVLDGVYEDKDVIKALDLDGDGKLNDDEKAKFEEFIKGYNSDGDELTEADIKRAYDDIKNGEFSYDADLKEKSEKINNEVKKESAERAKESASSQNPSSASSSRGSGSSGGAGGAGRASGYNSFSGSGIGNEQNIENMSLEQLKQEKTEKEGNVTTAQGELDGAKEAQEEKITAAQGEYDTAKEAYDEAVSKEGPEVQALNEQLQANLESINAQDDIIKSSKEIVAEKDRSIQTLNTSISANEANLSSLEASKSQLEQFNSDDPQKVQQAKTNAQAIQAQIDAVQKQIDTDKQKLEAETAARDEAQAQLDEATAQLETLKQTQQELQTQIEELCSEETKAALEGMLEAQTALEEAKLDKEGTVEKAQTTLDTAQKDLDEVNKQISVKENEKVEQDNAVSDLDFNFGENLTAQQQGDIEFVKQKFEENKDKYKAVEAATGIPAELVAAIHFREGSCNFDTYLHNGQPLGQTTTIVPKGIYFDNWTDAAIDAMSKYGGGANSVDKDDLNSYLDYAEKYNGLGYRKKGLASPYVWSGTTNYTGGLYVADGKFNPNKQDPRAGVAVILKALMS